MATFARSTAVHGPKLRQLRLHLTSSRLYSSAPSLITIETHPAPHCGVIATLSLNRPEARNAISRKLLSDLRSALSSLPLFDPTSDKPASPESVRALVIASSVPGIFCAGADLKERISFTIEQRTREFLANLRDTYSQIENLPIPSVAAIAGPALGGGLELALASTFRVASTGSKLGLPETRLGIIPGAGGTQRLPAVIGRQRALQMILGGRAMSAVEAESIGLVDQVVVSVKDDKAEMAQEVVEEARAFAEEILKGGPVAINMALKAVRNWKDREAEAKAYEVTLATEDRDAALKAFKEKTTPKFSGR